MSDVAAKGGTHPADPSLHDLEERFRAIAANTPDIILLQDLDLRYVMAINPQLGLTPAEMIGKTDHDLVSREDADELAALKRQALTTGKPVRVAMSLPSRQGTIESFEGTYVPKTDAAGQVDGLLGYFRNVTERKRTEAALTQAMTDLRRAQRAARLGSYRLDVSSGSWASSEMLDEVFGIGPGYARTVEGWLALIHPDDRDAMLGYLTEEVLGRRERFDREYRVIRASDHRETWVHGWGELEIGPNGEVLSMFGTIQDVTDRRRAIEALRLSEARYRQLVDKTDTGFLVVDDRGIVLMANAPYERIAGARSPSELVGRSVLEWTAPAERDKSAAALALCAERGFIKDFETVYQHRDGTRVYVIINATAEQAPDGRRHVLSYCRDNTERRRMEAEREKLVEALREADRRKDDFIAVLSHELRNPLAPIRSGLYVLERATPGGEQARRAEAVIARQVDHLARLVDDLLDVTRISRGKVHLQPTRLDLVDVVRRTIEDHRAMLGGHELAVELPQEAVWAEGDPTRLAQIVGNLLTNAAKFTPGDGRISLSLARANGRAVLKVTDAGVGIDPDTLGRLFEPFAQADRSLARSHGGLGLGLALVKGLVELHGGQVSAHSDGPGKGACFTVVLPIDEHPVVGLEHAAPQDEAAQGRSVLVIEDNRDAADSLAEALELSGHRVTVAYDGETGLARARELHPAFVLCDIGLPAGMDGYAVAGALRRDPLTASAYLVAVSGYAQPEDQRRARVAGFDAHMAKPPDLATLERLLARAPAEGA